MTLAASGDNGGDEELEGLWTPSSVTALPRAGKSVARSMAVPLAARPGELLIVALGEGCVAPGADCAGDDDLRSSESVDVGALEAAGA